MVQSQTVKRGKPKHIHIIVYGEPGVGKTVLAGSSDNSLLIRPSTDGTESLEKFGYSPQEAVVDTWDDMWAWYDKLKKGGHGFDWVWLDSVTLFQEMGLDDIMKDLLVEKPHRDPFQPGVENYGQNMNRLSSWIRSMRTLPVNFGLTAHIQRDEDHDGQTRYMPAIQGKNMPEKISGYMGIVGNLQVKEGSDGNEHRVLTTAKDGKWYGKDRYNLTESGYIVDPTIEKIEKLANQSRTQKKTSKKTSKKTTRKRPSR